MSQEITKIKSRIKSVSGALKVTSAMKLVSAVKLKRYKSKMLANRAYSDKVDEITKEVLRYSKSKENPFNNIETNSNKDLYIVVSSSLGLCGAYNANIFKVSDSNIKENDDVVLLGNKAYIHYENGNLNKVSSFEGYTGVEDNKLIKSLTSFVVDNYLNGKYKNIYMIYSSYKNSLVFIAKKFLILPLQNEEKDDFSYGPILEPNEKYLIDTLVPIYLKTTIKSKLLESEVCEQASRNNAMENATNNSEDLLHGLSIEFNKARQAAITQEIIEIVGASK